MPLVGVGTPLVIAWVCGGWISIIPPAMATQRMRCRHGPTRRGGCNSARRIRAQSQAQEATSRYHASTSPDTKVDIRQLESQVASESQTYLDSELVAEVSNWLPDPGQTRGQRNQYLHSVTLHWEMRTFLGRVLKEKREERNDIVSFLNDIRRIQRHQKYCLERLDVCLAHLESHLQGKGKLSDPAGTSAQDPEPVTSSDS